MWAEKGKLFIVRLEKTVRSSKSCTFCTNFRALNASDPNNYADET